jgi:hypothetical protein
VPSATCHAVVELEIYKERIIRYRCCRMGRHSIVYKLDQELHNFPIRRESQVVYLLAEIRKLIEHERETDPECYDILELFCNWALHISISRKSNADRIRLFLRSFDMRDGMEVVDHLNSAFYNEIMHLEAFRRELEKFLHDHQLPCDIVHCYKTWSGLIYLYTSVVAEVPLQYSRGDLLPKEVEELVIAHMPRTPPTPDRMVRWTVKLKCGIERVAMIRYGVYRDENKMATKIPDFYLEEGFQV